jgi:hypothetical protein
MKPHSSSILNHGLTMSRCTANSAAALPRALTLLAPGHAFTVPEVTFRKITDDKRLDWEGRFAGLRT